MAYDYLGEPEATYRIIGYRIDCPDPAEEGEAEPRTINILKEIYVSQKNGHKNILCAWRLRGFWKQNETTVVDPQVNAIITMYQSKLYGALHDGSEFGKLRLEIEDKVKDLFDKSEDLKKRNAVIIPPATGMMSAIKQRK